MMTNRQWLESLTNEDLAKWLCNQYPVNISRAPHYGIYRSTTGLDDVKCNYTTIQNGLVEWLQTPHKEI